MLPGNICGVMVKRGKACGRSKISNNEQEQFGSTENTLEKALSQSSHLPHRPNSNDASVQMQVMTLDRSGRIKVRRTDNDDTTIPSRMCMDYHHHHPVVHATS